MKHSPLFASLTLLALGCVTAAGASFTGTFLNEEERVEFNLEAAANGKLTGRMSSDGSWTPVSGKVSGDSFAGSIDGPDFKQPITGLFKGDVLEIKVTGPAAPQQVLKLKRVSTGEAAGDAKPGASAANTRPAAPAATPRPAPAAKSSRRVFINDLQIPDAELIAWEQQSHIRILDANYWYDAKCGAWGFKDGPTMGFLPAGLKLGGPLKANASGGNTRIFLNGREAHLQDVIALQSILGPILPGRYFVDAMGNAGPEGGAPLVNLVAAAQAATRAQSGGSNTWRSKILDAGGGGDASGSYVIGNGWSASTF